MRIDQHLMCQGFLPSRTRAKAVIQAGMVTVNGVVERRPGRVISDNDSVTLSEVQGYVGRGYLKLQGALDKFGIDVAGKTCMDVGASTGGFTQLLLERGAAKVYAVDVGTGQLSASLKADLRVVSLEQTDFRIVTPEQVGAPGFACVDVSFISLRLIFPKLAALLAENGHAVCLLKPQFETGARVKHGIVKDPKVQAQVIAEVCEAARQVGLSCQDVTFSPVTGREGNIEFLLHLSNNDNISDSSISNNDNKLSINDIVRQAWEELKA